MTFCDMDMLYRHTNCVFHRKLSFSMHLSLIENLHFHFIRNCDRVSNWLKSCDRSIFALHVFFSLTGDFGSKSQVKPEKSHFLPY